MLYLRYSEHGQRKRISLRTELLEEAQDLWRQFDSARMRGEQNVFPTKTPLSSGTSAYAAHMKATRISHGYTTDLSYLRSVFGPACDVLMLKRQNHRVQYNNADMRYGDLVIRSVYLEDITTAQVSEFFHERVERYGPEAKTANRHQEVLRRLFSWRHRKKAFAWREMSIRPRR